MKNNVVDKPTRLDGSDGKFGYFNSITKVTKEIKENGLIIYKAFRADDSYDCLRYKEGNPTSSIVYTVTDKSGKTDEIEVKPNGRKEYRCNRNNSQTAINEIIFQYERMFNGLDPIKGEYNHMYPLSWQIKHQGYETATIHNGEITESYLNSKHWNLLKQIKKDTGREYMMSAEDSIALDYMVSNYIALKLDYIPLLNVFEQSGAIKLIYKKQNKKGVK